MIGVYYNKEKTSPLTDKMTDTIEARRLIFFTLGFVSMFLVMFMAHRRFESFEVKLFEVRSLEIVLQKFSVPDISLDCCAAQTDESKLLRIFFNIITYMMKEFV
jgi:hypothetical protein